MSRSPVSVCLDKRKMTTTGINKGKFPVKIKVNFKIMENGVTKYVVKRYHVHPDQVFCRASEFLKIKRDPSVIVAAAKAIELFDKGLSIQDFDRLFTSSGELDEVGTVFQILIDQLQQEGRQGTANSYSQALSSFTSYKGKHITFGELSRVWLMGYERWCLDRGLSINTVGIYTRALRAVVNYAIDPLQIITESKSPFGRRKYIIPSGPRQIKKAFTIQERNIILQHRSQRSDVNMALDFWAFQYFGNGCNMADVAYMRRKHIDGTEWRFERKKTENTERTKNPIGVTLNERMLKIIARHGVSSLDPNAFVFPILTTGMTPRQCKSRIHDFIADVNELLAMAQEEINTDLEKQGLNKITTKLTTGTARYTAATILKKHGIDLSSIAKILGHGSESTTKLYTEDDEETRSLISRMLEA